MIHNAAYNAIDKIWDKTDQKFALRKEKKFFVAD